MADEALSPISAKKPPVVNPIAGGGAGSTLKLKPVIRKPVPGGSTPTVITGARLPTKPVVRSATPAAKGDTPASASAPAAPEPAPKALDALKSVTQRLKGVTQEIPQQAILRKTGIIADQALTDAQKQASKARTARISLSDAIGAAPVKNEGAPMKTIRIKRPLDLATPPPAKALEPAAASAFSPAADDAATMITQRKTLKISRPGTGSGRVPSKLAVKKPGGDATAVTKLSPGGGAPEAGGEVSDIPDIPDMAPVAPLAPAAPAGEKDVPVFVGILSLIVQVAACAAIGALSWLLFQDCQVPQF